MNITETKVTIVNLTKGYKDDGDGGVVGFDGKLTIRHCFNLCFYI